MPPFVDYATVDPDPRALLVTVDRGVDTEFTIPAVEDPDVSDVIYGHWFLDYERTRVLFDENRTFPSGQRKRTTAWVFSLDPCKRDQVRNQEMSLLEVDVSDREFQSGGDRPFRTVPSEAKVVTISWRLKFEGLCPQ